MTVARKWNDDFQPPFPLTRRARQWPILLFALLLAGCAAAGPSADDLRAIRSIRITPALNPVNFGVTIGGMPAPDEGRELTRALASQNLRLGDELTQEASGQLRRNGFEVTNSIAPSIPSDATLRLSITQSTYVMGLLRKVGPHLVVVATLTDRSGQKLFYRIYRYDMHNFDLGPTLGLTPSDRYSFDSLDDAISHPEIAAAGLAAAIPMITSDLGRTLRKRR